MSETTSELVLEAIEAWQAAGAVTSFDSNDRAKLWAARGGDAQAQQVIRRIAGRVDVLFGNEEDLQKGLGTLRAGRGTPRSKLIRPPSSS